MPPPALSENLLGYYLMIGAVIRGRLQGELIFREAFQLDIAALFLRCVVQHHPFRLHSGVQKRNNIL